MEVAGIPIKTFVGFILTIVALVIDLIGFAAPYWYMISQNGDSVYVGLWKSCRTISSTTTCTDLIDSDQESWFEAVQAMETLGFICLVAALVVAVLKLFLMKDKSFLKWVLIGCLAAAAAFILIGVCIYGGEASANATDNLHFAFAFVIIAALIAIGAAILFAIDK